MALKFLAIFLRCYLDKQIDYNNSVQSEGSFGTAGLFATKIRSRLGDSVLGKFLSLQQFCKDQELRQKANYMAKRVNVYCSILSGHFAGIP